MPTAPITRLPPNRFRQALAVQDACNLRGIARLLVTAADEAADEGDTEASYRDPAVVLIVNKIESLVHSDLRYSDAYAACNEKATPASR